MDQKGAGRGLIVNADRSLRSRNWLGILLKNARRPGDIGDSTHNLSAGWEPGCYPTWGFIIITALYRRRKKVENHKKKTRFLCIIRDVKPRGNAHFNFPWLNFHQMLFPPNIFLHFLFQTFPLPFLFCRDFHGSGCSFIFKRGDHMIRLISDISRLFLRCRSQRSTKDVIFIAFTSRLPSCLAQYPDRGRRPAHPRTPPPLLERWHFIQTIFDWEHGWAQTVFGSIVSRCLYTGFLIPGACAQIEVIPISFLVGPPPPLRKPSCIKIEMCSDPERGGGAVMQDNGWGAVIVLRMMMRMDTHIYIYIYIYIYIRITFLDDHMFLQMGVFGFEISFFLLVIPSHIANEMWNALGKDPDTTLMCGVVFQETSNLTLQTLSLGFILFVLWLCWLWLCWYS